MRSPDRRERLTAAAAALGLPTSDAEAERLLDFLALLQRWNGTYNLTAIRDPDQMFTQHLVDCMSVIRPLRQHLGSRTSSRLLDVGAGGALPGAVVAILCPTVDVTCVDAVGRKAAFIQQVAAQLRLGNLHARHARVEQLTEAPFDVVTSRAFASLSDFTRLTRSSLGPDGVWMAMKGKYPAEEIAALDPGVGVFHVEQLVVPGMDAERCLIWMRPMPSL